jgi:hypothetical protein
MASNPDPGTRRQMPVFLAGRLFDYALIISTVLHALALASLLTLPWGEEEQQLALQVRLESPPFPQKFVKSASPSRRPLSRPQQPQPVQRPLARKVSPKPVPRVAMSPVPLTGEAPRAGMPGIGGGAGGGNLFSAGKGSGGLLGMGIGPGGGVFSRHIGPKFQAGAVEGSRTGEGEIDLGMEMLDVKALDTGQHRALVVVDPRDKKRIKGFLYLTRVNSERLERSEINSPYPRRGNGVARSVAESQALEGLAQRMNQETGVYTELLDGVPLDDPRLLEVPFVFLTVNDFFEFTQAEARNLGRYLTGGGFLYAEVVSIPRPGGNGFTADIPALRALIRAAFSEVGYSEGKDWRFVLLPPEHPVYHCFFDLPTLPMGFWDTTEHSFFTWGENFIWSPEFLEGIQVGERLAGIYSQKNYCDYWAGAAARLGRLGGETWKAPSRVDIGGEEIPVESLGVNILVYALTQEGSLAQRLVSVE